MAIRSIIDFDQIPDRALRPPFKKPGYLIVLALRFEDEFKPVDKSDV